MKKLMLAVSAAALLAACGPTTEAPAPETTVVPAAPTGTAALSVPDYGSYGLDTSSWDPAVRPGEDFFLHASGTWVKTFEIPADKSSYGGFTALADLSEQRVRGIIEELAAASPDIATLEGKIAAYYNAYLDTGAINARGLAPAQPYLDTIAAIETREDLARVFARRGFSSPVGAFVNVDSKQPDRYIVYVSQSGLGLPDRDFYLKDDEKSVRVLEAYRRYVTFLLAEAGYEDPASAADMVIKLETDIARASWDRTLGRNRDLTYNLVTTSDLQTIAGDFPVSAWLEGVELSDQTEFVLRQLPPGASQLAALDLTDDMRTNLSQGIPALFEIAQTAPLDAWKAYLTAQFLSDHAGVLPSAIDEASFEMYGRTLRDTPQQRERWKRGVSATEGSLGEAVGKVYAERYFPAENKVAMEALVENLRLAMGRNLDDLTWMGEATKAEARAKLAKFTPKIGYPEKFETYEGLTVQPGLAFENLRAASEWAYQDSIAKLGQPIDKTEWFMLPQTVNAYYSPDRNEIVFPAAILQPPFFNMSADPAVNYGAIGAVIGHEMGHGFDDQGSKSDGDGRLRNWWTTEDKAAFETLTGALVEQYNAFCPFGADDKCVNGRLSLGENIGDLGGLALAYRAYRISLNGEEAPVIDGLTGDQRFFLAWAQVWRIKYRDEALRLQLQTGPHSPGQYRVNGIVRNMDAWYEAFGVTPEDALYLPPEQRIKIW